MTKKVSQNGSKPSKPEYQDLNAPKELDPLDRMDKAIKEGREATKMLDAAEDFEEKTGADHKITVNLTAPAQQPSQPQIEVSQQNPSVLNIAFAGVKQLNGWSLAAVLIVGILVYGWLRSIGAVK